MCSADTRAYIAKRLGSSPLVYSALTRREPNEPASSCSSPRRGDVSGTLSMLIEPAYAAVPLLLVPTPRWTCTELQAVGEIGEVGEVQHLIFRIVERNAVEREVDARLIDAAQPDVAVAPVVARFGVRGDRRRRALQQQRHVLAEVARLDVVRRERLLRDGRRAGAANRRDHDALEPLRATAVGSRAVSSGCLGLERGGDVNGGERREGERPGAARERRQGRT